MTTTLPVATGAQVRRAAWADVRADRGAFVALLALNALAAAAGLVGPWLLGRVVDAVESSPGPAVLGEVDRLALLILVATLGQVVLARQALHVGYRFGERAAARVRERLLDRVLALPASVVERTPAGDLIARGTTDTAVVATALRRAAPEVLVAVVQAVFLVTAVLVLDPLIGACGLACLVVVALALRWYLRRARVAYLAEADAGARLADVVASTAGGARTVEALGLARRREQAAEDAVDCSRRARLRTLWLRSVLFPAVDVSHVLPVVGVLAVGGALYFDGVASLGTVVAAAVYLRQLAGPLDTLMLWVDQLQSAGAAYARVEGLAAVGGERRASDAPADDRIEVAGVRYAYDGGPDVLHGIDLVVRPGERVAVVGPSGAGKSTLGRLLAGVDRPTGGRVSVGGVPVADLAPERLRRQVVLVTQDHHVFRATVRENLLVAGPDAGDAELRAALAAVGATWADELPDGLDTELGGAHRLDGGQAQQLSLARVVLADPHTVVLDEATALLDPTTARNTERALAAVLEGRTVIAIAHRLQTAHSADRVVVLEEGRLIEQGAHDDLVGRDGVYAALWRSWHGD
ncbi:ABC transporter ATP-binding protein [Saccharothrix australiensis]|uniref:ABC-type multidrug transport system fused ATPase/permease subunit n=1 Tax=Saccharothrix australiensis TaxID=2072 RepID=A0A495W1V6_9PSEU|nr:ABC transporter ATP-binding protein [Saccharothrix australiensis]RKT53848.1 ABC-type multidrug transport system fused ATPase/permease subunit [Saccharothrix australiensis]